MEKEGGSWSSCWFAAAETFDGVVWIPNLPIQEGIIILLFFLTDTSYQWIPCWPSKLVTVVTLHPCCCYRGHISMIIPALICVFCFVFFSKIQSKFCCASLSRETWRCVSCALRLHFTSVLSARDQQENFCVCVCVFFVPAASVKQQCVCMCV